MKNIKPAFGNDAVTVVLAADSNYAPCMTVVIASVVENSNSDNSYDIIVLEDGINFAYKKLIKNYIKEYDNISVRFFNVKRYIKNYAKIFFTNDYFSLAAYFRILIPDLLKDYEKAVYLDSDVMLLEDIALLYKTELGDNLVAATKDLGTYVLYKGKPEIHDYMDNNLKFPDMKEYFQNGVMVMNLTKLREINFIEKFIETVKTIKPPLYFVDQDIFNLICYKRVKFIDQRWDVVTNTGNITRYFITDISETVCREYLNNAKFAFLIHYVSFNWQYDGVPYTEIYWKYVNRLPKFVNTDIQKLIIKNSKELSEKKRKKKLFKLNIKSSIAYLFKNKKRWEHKKYYYNNITEQKYLAGFHKYFERLDFHEKYNALVKNLDSESIRTVDNTISLINKTKELLKGKKKIDLYSTQEKKIFIKHDKEFYSKTAAVGENLYRYKNYYLPVDDFGPAVFYYKHALDYIENIGYIKGKSIIDAGASVGDSALIFSELDCDRIYSFEPNKETFDLLNSTIKINMLSKVVPVRLALGSESTVRKLQLCGSGSTLLIDEHSQSDCEMQDTYVVRLDDYVKQHNIRVGLIKTDLEGFEQEFLKGAEYTIKTQCPILLISLYHKASDYFEIKPVIESWNLGYRFKIVKPLIYNVVNAETMLVAEVNED